MAYTTLADCKAYMGIADTTDDILITSLITRAQKIIEEYTGRIFEAETATKYFDQDNVEGRNLYLFGHDLLTVTTLINGDGTEIASANYRLEPRNETPKWMIRLDENTSWKFNDSDSEIIIPGTWGYSATAPADIVHYCIRLATFLYRQKDTSTDVDRPIVTGDGVTIMPANVPSDIVNGLKKYCRRVT